MLDFGALASSASSIVASKSNDSSAKAGGSGLIGGILEAFNSGFRNLMDMTMNIINYTDIKKLNNTISIREIMPDLVASGMSYEQIKALNPKLYRKNQQLFQQEYYYNKAIYDANQKQLAQSQTNLSGTIQPILIIVILCLLVYYVID